MIMQSRLTTFFLILTVIISISCSINLPPSTGSHLETSKADSLFIIDCLLPGQVRKLGQHAMYITSRRPIKTTASECEIRGGEYVAYDRADFKTSLKIWLPQAKSGNAEAQAYVGEIYEKGLGIPPNYSLAKQWYEKAAAQNNTKAQLNLGYLYEKGLGIPKNLPLAMLWYEKASGLEGSGITYSATISNDSEKNELSTEIKLLKTALNTSQLKTKQANKKLAKIQQSFTQQKILLDQSQSGLDDYHNQLSQAVRESNSAHIKQLKKTITEKENTLKQQQATLNQTQANYNENLSQLTLQLTNTQKRAQQVSNELLKNRTTNDDSQSQLLNTQAQLAETESKLLVLQQQSQKKLQSIHTENLLFNQQLTSQKTQTEYNLEQAQQQLIQQKTDKLKQTMLLAQLQQENTQYNQQIEQLQAEKKQSNTSKKRGQMISLELSNLKKSSQSAKQSLSTMQQKILATEHQLITLKLNSEAALTAAQADTEYSHQALKQQQSSLDLAEKRLKDYETKWKKQQTLTQNLLEEKKLYKKQLTQLNSSQHTPSTLSIEIIDPPFSLARGFRLARNIPTVSLRSIVKSRDVFGKVSSSKGLLSLLINDQKTDIDPQGIFKKTILLNKSDTPVQIVAIDKTGKRSVLDFIFSLDKAQTSGQEITKETQAKNPWETLDFGQYHALIIGNNNYQKVPSLDTPINDAEAIAKVLKEKYTFNSITLLKNASRYETLTALNELREKLTEDDNLIIYYAGHGELDKANMRGHWLPVDADANNTANWISTVAITDILNAMSAKHILVVSDSCYSGAMTRSSLARIDAGVSKSKKKTWLKAMLKTRSRTVLTSGGLKPVMDGGGGNHSVFAKAFIDTLRDNTDLLEGQDLYRKVSGNIISTASEYGIEQVPEYAPIRHAGHESGEFFLVPKT